ncbi:MAG: 4Fe-4S ferredoxin iron-sulfur binding domain protein, partial [Clostridiales bacterium]|nr:4Fe-4S ferredoxin iron-sulfur binding domain protein [Clostridiales bacterium]
DNYYEKKLENTVLIGFGCKSAKKGCFCAERGIDKGYSESCDIFIIENEEGYIAEAISHKGEQLLKSFDFETVQQEIPRNEPDPANLLDLNCDEKTLFETIDWGRISEKCIGCGTCTYICPSCHCFGFKDVVENGDSVRYKCWDSCMYPKFTLHTSGHNPRASKKERYRQRVMHKYHYVKKNFGYIACTGCGRCIRSCPAGMNIKSVVKDIMEEIK